MRKTVFQIKYIAAFLIFWLAGSACMAQPTPDAFTAWTFDDAYTPIYWYGTSYIAEYSDFTNTRLYADGTYGSSQFATVTTSNYAQMLKIDWTGTELGDTRQTPYAGYCLGFKHPISNGRSFVLSTPTSNYSKISLSYAVTRSTTGFKKISFYWSTDGSIYNFIKEIPCDALNFELQTLDLAGIPDLDDKPMIYIRVQIHDILSTAYQGNIKFDNLTFMGYKCMDTLMIHDTIFSGDNYYKYGFHLEEVYGNEEYLYERRVHYINQCDSMYQLFLYVNDTTPPPTPPTPQDPPTDTTETQDSVSVHDISLSIPVIYPNPFKDQLTIQFSEQNTARSISIYNSVGQLISAPLNSGTLPKKFTIETSQWPAGIYFIHIEGDIPIVQKVIKSSE